MGIPRVAAPTNARAPIVLFFKVTIPSRFGIRLGAPFDRRRAVQVGLDRRADVAKALAVNLQVLHYTLDVIACLGQRNALYPIDRVDLGISRIAVLRHPL